MRILILNWRDKLNPRAGGGDGLIHKVADFLASAGHEIEMITSKFPGAPTEEMVGPISVHRLRGEIGSHVSIFVGSLNKLHRYDVVWDVINLLPWIRARRPSNGVRLRAMMHQFTYEALRFETNALFASVGRIVERRVTPRIYMDVPVAVLSESIRQECLRRGFYAQNVVSIPPGIEYNTYAMVPKPDSVLRIIYIGRLSRYKGVQYLIQATAQVLRNFPTAILDIVGQGYFRPQLTQLARQLKLSGHVAFHGLVDERTKLDLLQKSWILVMPSVQEGWGIPVLEAAAAGLPSIGTNTTGLCDSIVHGSTGLLVPFGDSRAIAEAIIRLAQDSDLRRAYGANARRRARNFDWSHQLPRYASFLLDEWRPSVP